MVPCSDIIRFLSTYVQILLIRLNFLVGEKTKWVVKISLKKKTKNQEKNNEYTLKINRILQYPRVHVLRTSSDSENFFTLERIENRISQMKTILTENTERTCNIKYFSQKYPTK